MLTVNVRPLLFSLAGLSVSINGFAQTWDGGGGSGNYGAGANWNPNGVPGNVVINFNGAAANGQRSIGLGATRTIAGIVFFSAAGVNPFTFSNNQFNIGSSGIVNNDTDAQVFNSSLTMALTANQTWNAAAGNLVFNSSVNIGANTLTLTGSRDFTFTRSIVGSGTIVKQGSGTVRVSGGGSWSVPHDITITGGLFQLSPAQNFEGFDGAVSISGGGTLKLTPGNRITDIVKDGLLTFGTTGGTLELGSTLAKNTTLGPVTVNSSAATPAIIRYNDNPFSPGSSPYGWEPSEHSLVVANGDLSGLGALSFQVPNGAMIAYNQANYSGSLNFSGTLLSNPNPGRLLLDTAPTFTVANGITFDKAMQVMIYGGPRTIDANITIRSGETSFQGGARGAGPGDALTIGSTVGGVTLTVKDRATATMDVRLPGNSSHNIGGIVLNANTLLESGGTLNLAKTAASPGENVGSIIVNGDIIGQGTTARDSFVTLNTSSFTFTAGTGTAGSDLIVNGSGLGGLRVEGTQERVDALLTPQRLQDLTGSGGTLTVAYTDSGARTFRDDPNIASNVRLGFDAPNGPVPDNGALPLYMLGGAVNDLASWGGLVVKGGDVRVMVDESMTGSSAVTTSLDMLGGNLILHDFNAPRTLTFEGGANLIAGKLDGGGGSGGTLVLGGDLVAGPSLTLANSPNITINVSGPAAVSGSPIVGVGTFTKQGNGTVTLGASFTANTIDIQSGTLLLGGANLIGNSTAMKLSGGSFATGGQNEALGRLTLAANSTIDLGSGASILNFGDSSGAAWVSGSTLTIANWNSGSDHLFFGNAMSALTGGQVSQIQFLNPNGVSGVFGAMILSTGEIVPVPEPATIGFGALLVGSLGFRERRRLSQWTRSLLAVWRKVVAA